MSELWFHLAVDVFDCDLAALRSKQIISELIGKIVTISKMKILGDLVTRELPETEQNKKQGIDGVSFIQAIQTSTITIHAVPSRHALHFDMLSCKEFDQKSVVLLILGAVKSQKYVSRSFTRPTALDSSFKHN